MLQLIVLRHKPRQLQRESLNHTRVLQHSHQAFGVFLQLLWLEFLINVQILNPILQSLDDFDSFFVLANFVRLQVR